MFLCVFKCVCIDAQHSGVKIGHVLINQTQCGVYCSGDSIKVGSAGLKVCYGVRGLELTATWIVFAVVSSPAKNLQVDCMKR